MNQSKKEFVDAMLVNPYLEDMISNHIADMNSARRNIIAEARAAIHLQKGTPREIKLRRTPFDTLQDENFLEPKVLIEEWYEIICKTSKKSIHIRNLIEDLIVTSLQRANKLVERDKIDDARILALRQNQLAKKNTTDVDVVDKLKRKPKVKKVKE